MSRPWSFVARFAPLAILINLSGCFSTTLPPIGPPKGIERLLRTADRTIVFSISPTAFPDTAGHQFLFFLFPVTRIYTPHATKAIATALSIDGASKGYKLVPQSTSRNPLALRITVLDLSVSGFDLLFLRRPSASITLKGELESNGALLRGCEVQATESRTKAYAFEQELNGVLWMAIQSASAKLFSCLRL